MTSTPQQRPDRQAAFVVECVICWLVAFIDGWLWLQLPRDVGVVPRTVGGVTAVVGFGAAIVAVARRGYGSRLALGGGLLAAASLIVTVVNVQARAVYGRDLGYPSAVEVVALALLTGAMCRRLAPRLVIPLVLLTGSAMTLGPLLRLGVGSRWALLAVPAAIVWGGSVGVGLIHRDADGRRRAALAASRADERLNLARELHDFVAHHITGIVVLAQGGQVAAAQDTPVLKEIEQAGSEALTAMRRLVGVLRTETPASLSEALAQVRGDDDRINLSVAAEAVRPELITAAHRIAMESVTNARRYAPAGTPIDVTARVVDDELVIEVVNDIAPGKAKRGRGYGLVGMAERARAVGGTIATGAEDQGRWRVRARLPLTQARTWI